MKEDLTTCEVVSSDILVEAAEMKGDEAMLMKIKGKDLVAIEVRYHHKCFRIYLQIVYYKRKCTDEQSSDSMDDIL